MKITEIIDQKMPSITEWMEQINLDDIEKFRQEDNNKRDRLEILFDVIGLQYDRPEKMTATDIVEKTDKFLDILERKGNEKCALRLVPIVSNLPKLRVRGKTLRENLVWFNEQKINPANYKVEVIPHNDDTEFSATFLINDFGIFGEIVPGPHWQLTQGFFTSAPIIFNFDYKDWNFSIKNQTAEELTKQAMQMLLVPDEKKQILQNKLNTEFSPLGHIKGYFEFVVWPDNGISFIDYNRILYNLLKDAKPNYYNFNSTLSGICANTGKVTGTAKIISDPHNTDFSDGDILICEMTMIDYVPLMKKAAGIITAQGSILSHAAIVARELGKPCLVGVKNILTEIKDGQNITLDANNGRVIIN